MQIEFNMTDSKTYTWEEVKKNPGAYKASHAEDNDSYLLSVGDSCTNHVLYVNHTGSMAIAREDYWKSHKYIKVNGTITLRF